MRRVLAVVFLSSCSGSAPAPVATMENKTERPAIDADFDSFDKQWMATGEPSYRGVFIGHGGVIVDHTRVSTLADIVPNLRAIKTAVDDSAHSKSIVLDLDGEPASTLIIALRSVARDEPTSLGLRMDDPKRPVHPLCEGATLRAHPAVWADGEEHVTLSVFFDAERTWVGLSRVNEFQEIPDRGGQRDFEKLETVLKEHKASAFFADRNDAELGAEASQKASDVIYALDIMCKVGWINIAVLPRQLLSAVPQL